MEKEIAYYSSKAAVLDLTRALAVEFGPAGITSNAICPGPVETVMLRSTYQALADENGVPLLQSHAEILKTIPVARFGKPEDVAALVTFLASAEAGFINGQSISIDGGMVFLERQVPSGWISKVNREELRIKQWLSIRKLNQRCS